MERTIKEAYENILEADAEYCISDMYNNDPVLRDDFLAAMKALEKQIPMKPYHENIYKCSRCDGIVGANHGCIDYCYHCGQAIDWSDE